MILLHSKYLTERDGCRETQGVGATHHNKYRLVGHADACPSCKRYVSLARLS